MENKVIGSIILEGQTSSKIEDVIVTSNGAGLRRVEATGILQDLDVENRNHRIYALEDMKPEIGGPRMKELLKLNQMDGECGHPLSDSLVRQQTIDPKLTCVRYTNIWLDGNLVRGNFKGTNNAYGEAFDMDLRDGCLPAFSLRALGSIENVNGKAYVRNPKIITYDQVIFASHARAHTEKLITESAIVEESAPVGATYEEYNAPEGKIIKVYGSDAISIIDKLQQESANISAILETFECIADKVVYENGFIKITNRYGDKISVRLENYVDNLILNWV